MDGTDTDQALASKWDIPVVLYGVIRVAFADLPIWAKGLVFALVGFLGVWTAATWFRGRRSRVR
ncbi:MULTISPECIES: hypothetical protein [unclassified Streptomyces]|uniref:hypothetical protein n=1 Tax=unclassified Streptomyces TaxID=2593676 RepID=UPI0004454E90|nr:hypothetical protein [Streptomyces sp. PCS3-D2]WKV75047.1 hypothetical protein AW27_028125 [Streptomyces sp. PCS3-D2]